MKKKSLCLACAAIITSVAILCSSITTKANGSFSDVVAGTWYYNYIYFLSDYGIMSGYGDGTFGPSDTLSRAQFATVLYRMYGESGTYENIYYTDVVDGAWYVSPVCWATSTGVFTGYGDGTFGPDDPITREQVATVMLRFTQLCQADDGFRLDLISFYDYTSVSGYAVDAMKWAVGHSIINGSNNYLNPQGSATRAECATIIARYLMGGDEYFQALNGSAMTLGDEIAEYAQYFEGNPYVWGGTDLYYGCDCSGFVYALYRDYGITLPRTSYEMAIYGTEISESNIQPGDIVVYSNGGHVALYIGNSQIIHAVDETQGIKVSSVNYSKIYSIRRCW